MNQHHVQEAYLKSFRDPKTGKVWVYSKTTGERFQKSSEHCSAEIDFQSAQLEKAQNDIVESPGIKALKQLQLSGGLSDAEYHLVSQWTALHLIRNAKSIKDLYYLDLNKKAIVGGRVFLYDKAGKLIYEHDAIPPF